MPTFLVWNLIFIVVWCSKNYLNLTKNFQLLTEARYFLETQEIQINEYQGCIPYSQYLSPGEGKSLILRAYSKYIEILEKNRDGILLTMRQVTEDLNLSSFVVDANLQNALLIKILSVHSLLHPMEGLFNTKGLTSFILKAHLYLRQLEYMGLDADDDCGILSAIESLHKFLYEWPEQGYKRRNLLETSHSTIKNHPFLKSSSEDIEEESHPILKSSSEDIEEESHPILKSSSEDIEEDSYRILESSSEEVEEESYPILKSSSEDIEEENHPILKISSKKIEEESSIETSKNPKPLRSRHPKPGRYSRTGVYIGLFLVLLFFIFFMWMRVESNITGSRAAKASRLVKLMPRHS